MPMRRNVPLSFEGAYVRAGAIGAFLGGWATEAHGYGAVCLAATFVVALAVLVSAGSDRRSN